MLDTKAKARRQEEALAASGKIVPHFSTIKIETFLFNLVSVKGKGKGKSSSAKSPTSDAKQMNLKSPDDPEVLVVVKLFQVISIFNQQYQTGDKPC